MATKTFGATGGTPWLLEVNKTADYPLVLADSGTLFTTGGGATRTFTLPALASGVGLVAWFLNIQNNTMVITGPANKLITLNGLTNTTITYSTASNIIGAFCMVYMNAAGTFYVHTNLGAATNTPS